MSLTNINKILSTRTYKTLEFDTEFALKHGTKNTEAKHLPVKY